MLLNLNYACKAGRSSTSSFRAIFPPFVAYELCVQDATKRPRHLYRHDLESFMWVLLWISCYFEEGRHIETHPLHEWVNTDWGSLRRSKVGITGDAAGSNYPLTDTFKPIRPYIGQLAALFHIVTMDEELNWPFGNGSLDGRITYEIFREILVNAWKEMTQ